MKKTLCILMTVLLTVLTSCQKKEEITIPEITDYPIEHEEEFGGVYIKEGIEDFNSLGFDYGDSVDVLFDNGYALEDIPYYNGYYVDAGEALLIAYPGYEYIKVTKNYGQDIWDEFDLKLSGDIKDTIWLVSKLEEHNKATVRLREKAKYLDIQTASNIGYYDERDKYDSDEIFANFRMIKAGNIKEGTLYRGASPCDDQHKRASYADALIRENGVNAILDLADNYNKIERYMANEDFNSPYFKTLYDEDRVVPIALNMNFYSDEFGIKLAQGLSMLAQYDPPYYIHCTEGKDRTGFVCMLLEALCGTSYEEIEQDYMKTYDNYYWIDENDDRYETILTKNLHKMIIAITDESVNDFRHDDLSSSARHYLLKMGMSEEDIDLLISRLVD